MHLTKNPLPESSNNCFAEGSGGGVNVINLYTECTLLDKSLSKMVGLAQFVERAIALSPFGKIKLLYYYYR